MHKTVFHWGQNDVILFKDWVLYTPKETFFTCLLLVLLGVLYQGIKFCRQVYGRKCLNIRCKRYMLSKGHVLQTLMYVVQFLWGYSLMLSVMTFNTWLLISVLAGFGLGYFFFGWGEYEDRRSGSQLRNFSRDCGIECNAACSSSTTRELLLNDGGDGDVAFVQDNSSAVMACNCDDSEL